MTIYFPGVKPIFGPIAGPVFKTAAEEGLTPGYVLDIFSDVPACYTLQETNRLEYIRGQTTSHEWYQDTNSQRPYFDSDHQSDNGKNIFWWNGDKWCFMTAYSNEKFISGTNGQTIMAVCKGLSSSAYGGDVIFAHAQENDDKRLWELKTPNYTVQSDGGSWTSSQVADYTRTSDQVCIWAVWNPGVETSVYFNNNSSPEGQASSPASTLGTPAGAFQNRLCARANGDKDLDNGGIMALVAWKFPLTYDQRAANFDNIIYPRYWL